MPRPANSPYTRCLDTMYGLRRFGIKLGLDTIGNILAGLDNPHRQYRCIHIAGTNGKGSVAAMLTAVLCGAGYRVGTYTSPHLVDFNERICINGRPVSDDAVVADYQAVQGVHHGGREPTFFEFSTAMALHRFAREKVDWAVIETGMGGRLDATNVVTPQVAVITNISIEHKGYLGSTLAEIAGEKAGIIKTGVPVVTGVRQKPAVAAVENAARKQNAPLYRLGRDFRFRRNPDATFTYSGRQVRKDLAVGLRGDHQYENAALAIAVCEHLPDTADRRLTEAVISEGIANAKWPGRLELVGKHPEILLDGAHNLTAARRLASYLKSAMSHRRIIMVIGMLDDKPYAQMLKILAPLAHRLVLTRPVIDRALSPEQLHAVAAPMIGNIDLSPTVADALQRAMSISSGDDLVCVAGSLYVVGEAKEALDPELSDFRVCCSDKENDFPR